MKTAPDFATASKQVQNDFNKIIDHIAETAKKKGVTTTTIDSSTSRIKTSFSEKLSLLPKNNYFTGKLKGIGHTFSTLLSFGGVAGSQVVNSKGEFDSIGLLKNMGETLTIAIASEIPFVGPVTGGVLSILFQVLNTNEQKDQLEEITKLIDAKISKNDLELVISKRNDLADKYSSFISKGLSLENALTDEPDISKHTLLIQEYISLFTELGTYDFSFCIVGDNCGWMALAIYADMCHYRLSAYHSLLTTKVLVENHAEFIKANEEDADKFIKSTHQKLLERVKRLIKKDGNNWDRYHQAIQTLVSNGINSWIIIARSYLSSVKGINTGARITTEVFSKSLKTYKDGNYLNSQDVGYWERPSPPISLTSYTLLDHILQFSILHKDAFGSSYVSEYKKADQLKTPVTCYALQATSAHHPFSKPVEKTFYLDPKLNDSYRKTYTFPSNGVTCASAINFTTGIGAIDFGFEPVKEGKSESEDEFDKRKTSYRAGMYRHYKTFYLEGKLTAESDNWADRNSICLHGSIENGLSSFFFSGLFDLTPNTGEVYSDAADGLKNGDSLRIGGLVMRDQSSYAYQVVNSIDATFTLDAFCGLVAEALQTSAEHIPHHSDPLLGLKIVSIDKHVDLTFKQQSSKRTLWTAKLIANPIDQASTATGYFAICDGGNTLSIASQPLITGLLSASAPLDKKNDFSFKGLYGDEKMADFYIYDFNQPFGFLPFDGDSNIVLSVCYLPSYGNAEAPFLFGNLTLTPIENAASKIYIRSVYSNSKKKATKGKIAVFTPKLSFIIEDVLKGEKANVLPISSNPFDLFLPANNNVPHTGAVDAICSAFRTGKNGKEENDLFIFSNGAYFNSLLADSADFPNAKCIPISENQPANNWYAWINKPLSQFTALGFNYIDACCDIASSTLLISGLDCCVIDLQEGIFIQKKQPTLSLFPELKAQGFNKTIDAVANLGVYQFGLDKMVDTLVENNSIDGAKSYDGFEFLLFFSDKSLTMLLHDATRFSSGIVIWPNQEITEKFPQIQKMIPETKHNGAVNAFKAGEII
ncbi:hypothetical protein [Chromobacterium sp. CV08]|uniref:hypothetical protein n=1 Tax=Chromobacterium sp. CV08 TaxID=3133274 RepID=UPI003DA954F3